MADETVPNDPDQLVSDETRTEQQEEAAARHEAPQEPTAEEEAAADRSRDSAAGVEEPYRDMTRKGAEVKGEGEVS